MDTLNPQKVMLAIGLVSVITLVSACGSNEEVKNEPVIIGEPKVEVSPEIETDKEEETEEKAAEEKVVVEEVENREQAQSFSHIHGLSYHPADSNKIMLASHNGLLEYNKEIKKAFYVGTEKFDLMGYTVIPNTDILLTSGHPGEGSKLPNPLGFLWSEDYGQTWAARGLHGMIDFHALTATSDQSKLLGYGSDLKKNVLFESTDQGFTWEVLKSNGIPLSHDEFFDMEMAPNNGDIVYAATNQGLFYSSNGGVDWTKKLDGYITALLVLNEDEVVFYEANQNGLVRLKGDETFTYEIHLGNDAVSYIALADYSKPEAVLVSTYANNILETEDHGKLWNFILKEGKF